MASVGGQFRREIEALEEIFLFLDAFAENEKIDEKDAFSIRLVVEELFTNLVRHNQGGGDAIDLTIERAGNRVLLELVDTDVEPFDPETAEIPQVAAGIEERRPGGLGIFLVRKTVDDLSYHYEAEDRRMRVSVIKTLES